VGLFVPADLVLVSIFGGTNNTTRARSTAPEMAIDSEY
jgi:hypothetical protein